jgi:hypothetical protein
VKIVQKAVWRHCRELAATVPLPVPFEFGSFLDALGQARGRPIVQVPTRDRAREPCGLIVATADADYLFYAADTTPLHQAHIRFHEVAHLLCGHLDGATAEPDWALMGALMPSLSPDLVRRVLGRITYSRSEEQAAELLASLLMRRVDTLARQPMFQVADSELAGKLQRLGGAFDTAPARHG